MGSKRQFSRDRLMNAPRREVAHAAMGVVDGVQRFNIEHRLLGMAAAFLIMCEELGIDPFDAATGARNIMLHKETGKRVPEFLAVGDYIRNET